MGIIRNSQSTFNNPSNKGYDSITTGVVVDTNDPMEQGRVRVACKALGDALPNEETFDVKLIPWASAADLTGGVSKDAEIGSEQTPVNGLLTFGEIKQIPEFTTAIIGCLDGNVNFRVVLGVLHPHLTKNGLPSGRYKINDDGELDGPFTIDNEPLEPIYSILRDAFNTSGYEWVTRGAILGPYSLSSKVANDIDDTFADERNITINLSGGSVTLPNSYYRGGAAGWGVTTKGQHFIYMDDRPHSSKIIVRSTNGRQIILDDTNERIYISTPRAKNFVEMDDGGNIDIFSETRVSIRGTKDVNLSSEGALRLFGRGGIHLLTPSDVRMTSNRHHINTSEYANNSEKVSHVTDEYTVDTDKFGVDASSDATLIGGSSHLELSSSANLISSGTLSMDGSRVMIAPPSAPPKPSGVTLKLDVSYAYNVNRAPFNKNSSGVNWSRSSLNPSVTDNDGSSNVVELTSYNNMEFQYTDSKSNKSDLGDVYERGTNWKR